MFRVRKGELPEIKEAKSLRKEYEMFKRYAATPGIAKIEQDYFMRMATNTEAKINWRLLEKKKKKEYDSDDS
jgi:hypothetical protein